MAAPTAPPEKPASLSGVSMIAVAPEALQRDRADVEVAAAADALAQQEHGRVARQLFVEGPVDGAGDRQGGGRAVDRQRSMQRPRRLRGIDLGQHLVGARGRRRAGERHGLGHLAVDGLLHDTHRRLVAHRKSSPQAVDGVLLALARLLRGRAVQLGLTLHVAVVAVGENLDEAGLAVAPHLLDERHHVGVQPHGVAAVEARGLDGVGGSALVDLGHGRVPVDRRELAVAVVLDDHQHGQVEQADDVHGLVEHALVHRAVAGDHHRDVVGRVVVLDAEGRAEREQVARTDDAVGPEHTVRAVGDVHRAAAPAAQPGLLAIHLGHHALQVGALGDDVPVAAVAGIEVVAVAQGAAHGRGHRLLADRQVDGLGGELAGLERRSEVLLEAADGEHDAIELDGGPHRGCRYLARGRRRERRRFGQRHPWQDVGTGCGRGEAVGVPLVVEDTAVDAVPQQRHCIDELLALGERLHLFSPSRIDAGHQEAAWR